MPSLVKKVFTKARRAVQNRYIKKRSNYAPKWKRIVRDVTRMKAMLNVEKKRWLVPVSATQVVGQVNHNASGHYLYDITPQPIQGNGYDQRSGNSIKWTSSFIEFQFNTQNNDRGCSGMIYFIKIVGEPRTTISNIMPQFLQPNYFIQNSNAGSPAIYDTTSSRNPDYFKNFQVIRKKRFGFKPDDYSTQTYGKNVKLGLKLKDHHVKWSLNTSSTTPSQGQVLMLIVLDNGNSNSANASTLTNVYQQSANTGLYLNYNMIHYYVDN